MIEIHIPGGTTLRLENLILDYNGTIACDGKLLEGVESRLEDLAKELQIHVLTADTFGQVRSRLENVRCELVILPGGDQDMRKHEYMTRLEAGGCACVGNGRNDRLMLKDAALGIAVVLEEGASTDALLAADVVCTGIIPALNLLLNPLRLAATLRT